MKNKKIKIAVSLAFVSIVGCSLIPLTMNLFARNKTILFNEEGNLGKISYDGKIFDSMEAVTDYYLLKNNAVNSNFYFGDAFGATYDQTNGFLDISQLYKNDYSHISNAYQNGFGGYEKSKQRAMSTFINETKIVTKYSDYHGGYYYDYADAAASLSTKTETYDVVYSDVKFGINKSFFLNPTNTNDQDFLKWSAINSIDKLESPFSMLYYYDEPQNETYEALGNYEIQQTYNSIGTLLQEAMSEVLNQQLKYSAELKGRGRGIADFNIISTGWTGDDLSWDWQNFPDRGDIPSSARKNITFNNLSFLEAVDLNYFIDWDNAKRFPKNGFFQRLDDGRNSRCCPFNKVAKEKTAVFSGNRSIKFVVSGNTLSKFHIDHGILPGMPGTDTALFYHKTGHYMNFDLGISPSYLLSENNRITIDKNNPRQFKLAIVKEVVKKVYAKLAAREDPDNHKFLKLTISNVYEMLNKYLVDGKSSGVNIFNGDFSNVFKETIDAEYTTENFGEDNFYSATVADEYRGNDTDSLHKKLTRFISYIESASKINQESFLLELFYNNLQSMVPIITYNGRPLYSVNLFKGFSDEQIEQKLIYAKTNLNAFNGFNVFIMLLSLNVLNNDRVQVSDALSNVSQKVLISDSNTNKYEKYMIHKTKNNFSWTDVLDPKDVINVPNIWVNSIGNKLSNLKSDFEDELLYSQVLHQYQEKGNQLSQAIKDEIPILYDETGVPNLYISAYLGNTSDLNVSLNNHDLPLYNDDKSLLNGIKNLESLIPSRVRLIIGPYGDPIQLESDPTSDGFFNSLENTLVNAGYEFIILPSETLMFYDDQLISNKLQLIYCLTISNKNLYFLDYYKLKTYVQSLLSLEIKYV